MSSVRRSWPGTKVFPLFQPPPAYTGELFGVEYLLAQSGKQFSPAEEDFDSCPDEWFEENQVPGTKSLHAVQSL